MGCTFRAAMGFEILRLIDGSSVIKLVRGRLRMLEVALGLLVEMDGWQR